MKLQNEGFAYRGKRFHLITLGMKGDLPYLTKTGRFDRHWLRAERKHKTKAGLAPVGVCWLCYAGTQSIPFEDFNWSAKWASTPAPLPWSQTPSLLRLYHQPSCPEKSFRPDIWHNYHGGCGKYWVASAMAEILASDLVSGTSRVGKVQAMDKFLRSWAKQPGNALPHSGGFAVERIQLTSWVVQPEASWSKHDDTRLYHQFMEDFLNEREKVILEDPVLSRILFGTRCVNRLFKTLYESGLWLDRREARSCGLLGRQWLRLYAELAALCLDAGRLRFPLVVKHHLLDHTMRLMLQQAFDSQWIWNPLGDSVQMDEDFIGHSARLSRRVNPSSQALRVLERYRTRAMQAWKP